MNMIRSDNNYDGMENHNYSYFSLIQMYTIRKQCTYINFFVCITDRKEVVVHLY